MKYLKYHYFIINLFLFIGCASVSSPTGGKKDIKPPKLINNFPKNKSTNYKGQLIELEFNEYVKVENLKQELLITPNNEGEYQYKLTKTGVRLTFDKPFKSNTTYTFNFRNTFKDITENNIAKNTKLVFSTGNVIDTLTIKGNVKDPLLNKNIFDVVVALYRVNDTMTIYKDKPYYITKTDSAGNFALENIKGDSYKIYAIEDKNGNMKYDVAERIAFATKVIELKANINNENLSLVKIDKLPPKVEDTDSKNNQYDIIFNEGIIDLKIELPQQYESMRYMMKEDKKLTFFKQGDITDSIPVKITAIDSSGNSLNKTIKIKFKEDKKERKEKVKNNEKVKEVRELLVTTNPKNGQEVENDFTYTVEFGEPITKYELKNIKVIMDTLNLVPLVEANFQWNTYKTQLDISIKSKAKREIGIRIPKGTFISVEGDTNKIIKTDHKLKELENYGSISGKVTTSAKSFIVQLLSSDYKILEQKFNKPNFIFSFLNAGAYRVRVIEDSNSNGKWDSGDMESNILPENIVIYSNEIKLKQNWDIQDIDITIL